MKKYKSLVLALIAFACIMLGNSTLTGALAISCTVLVSCILTTVIMAVISKALTEKAKIIVSAIIAAFFSLAFGTILAAYAYSTFKILAVFPAALSACAAMGSVYAKENSGIKASINFAISLLAVSLISGVIREIFGSASIAGYSIDALANAKCAILSTNSGGFIIAALVLACIRKILPETVKESLSSEDLPFFMTSRFASNAIPAAFAGVPSFLLILSIISMVLYAYL